MLFRRTVVRPAPVITLLTGSPSHSIKVASLLRSLAPTTIEIEQKSSDGDENNNEDRGGADGADALDQTLQSSSSIFGLRRQKETPKVWNSVAVRCQNSGSIFHLLSQSDSGDDTEAKVAASETTTQQPLQLVAVTDSDRSTSTRGNFADDAISDARNIIAEEILKNRQYSTTTSRLMTRVKSAVANYRNLNGSSTAWEILSGDNLPILSLPTTATTTAAAAASPVDSGSSASMQEVPFLKEIVIPSFDFASYEDGSTIFTRLSFSEPMKRVVTGVYQWPDSLTSIRPLPTSAEDRRLPPPSVIFFHNDVSGTVEDITSSRRHGGGNGDNDGDVMAASRIGYNGLGDGQVMLEHPDLLGLDVRLCPKPNVSPAFSEAQESLLAASMDELQNANTLNAGRSEEAKDDERVGKGDCWVELRANAKQPGGFFRSGGVTVTRSSSRKQRIAKIPDLPYE